VTPADLYRVAATRGKVLLNDGHRVTLKGVRRGDVRLSVAGQARVVYPSGRERTISVADIAAELPT
jgi:hypothetical protein